MGREIIRINLRDEEKFMVWCNTSDQFVCFKPFNDLFSACAYIIALSEGKIEKVDDDLEDVSTSSIDHQDMIKIIVKNKINIHKVIELMEMEEGEIE